MAVTERESGGWSRFESPAPNPVGWVLGFCHSRSSETEAAGSRVTCRGHSCRRRWHQELRTGGLVPLGQQAVGGGDCEASTRACSSCRQTPLLSLTRGPPFPLPPPRLPGKDLLPVFQGSPVFLYVSCAYNSLLLPSAFC